MIKKITFLIAVFAIAFISINAINNFAKSNQTGAPTQSGTGGYTGSTSDGMDCTTCHANKKRTVTGWITSDIPGTGYIPNTLYHITLTATCAGQTIFGFQVSPTDNIGNPKGNIANVEVSNTKVVSSPGTSNNKFITHKSAGTTGSTGTHTWTFNWTSPALGVATTVIFSGAFIAGTGSYSTTDSTFLTSYTVAPNTSGIEDLTTDNPIGLQVFPNPSTEQINIHFSLKDKGAVVVSLLTLDGRSVSILDKNSYKAGNYDKQYLLSNKPASGVYFVSVKVNTQTYLKKIIVQ